MDKNLIDIYSDLFMPENQDDPRPFGWDSVRLAVLPLLSDAEIKACRRYAQDRARRRFRCLGGGTA
jgi:hypothetical protein